jgi:hypothetical protein
MNATVMAAIVVELLKNLPSVVATANDLMAWLNRSYHQIVDAYGDRDVTPEEIAAIVTTILKNSDEIQSIP